MLANLALEEGDEKLPQTLKLGFDPIRPRNVISEIILSGCSLGIADIRLPSNSVEYVLTSASGELG